MRSDFSFNTAINFNQNDPESRRSRLSFNTAINFNQNDPESRRSRRQRLDVWTIACCVRHALGCGGRVWPIRRRVCCWRPDVYHRHVFFLMRRDFRVI